MSSLNEFDKIFGNGSFEELFGDIFGGKKEEKKNAEEITAYKPEDDVEKIKDYICGCAKRRLLNNDARDTVFVIKKDALKRCGVSPVRLQINYDAVCNLLEKDPDISVARMFMNGDIMVGVTEEYMKKLTVKRCFVSVPMRGGEEEDILACIKKFEKIAKDHWPGVNLEFVNNYDYTPEKEEWEGVKFSRLLYLSEAVRWMSTCNYFIGLSPEDAGIFDGCKEESILAEDTRMNCCLVRGWRKIDEFAWAKDKDEDESDEE